MVQIIVIVFPIKRHEIALYTSRAISQYKKPHCLLSTPRQDRANFDFERKCIRCAGLLVFFSFPVILRHNENVACQLDELTDAYTRVDKAFPSLSLSLFFPVCRNEMHRKRVFTSARIFPRLRKYVPAADFLSSREFPS